MREGRFTFAFGSVIFNDTCDSLVARPPKGNIGIVALLCLNRWICMMKLYGFLGATAGSYAGWYLGSPMGFMTAFMLSMVGTGFGIYAGRRVAQHYGA